MNGYLSLQLSIFKLIKQIKDKCSVLILKFCKMFFTNLIFHSFSHFLELHGVWIAHLWFVFSDTTRPAHHLEGHCTTKPSWT